MLAKHGFDLKTNENDDHIYPEYYRTKAGMKIDDIDDVVDQSQQWADTEVFMGSPEVLRVVETKDASEKWQQLIEELKKIDSFVSLEK